MNEFLALYIRHLPQWMPEMLLAATGTVRMTALAFCLANAAGLLFALARLSTIRALSALAVTYIEVVRGIPALTLLFLIYFALPGVGVRFDSFTAAVIGLGLNGAAYLAEVFRAGIQAIHRGQVEAALSIGLTPLKTMRLVILPQAFRIALPPIANYAIALLKDTSVASIIAAPELMLRARDLASSSYLPMHLFLLAALMYFAMSYPISLAIRR
ncbi:MAG: amino acid ABC transporter permease, partial [Chloroflexota bacterium]|nr:amino acid ABC transporter permease [Chloroflexota bacterium]